jgi:hypothetical protein
MQLGYSTIVRHSELVNLWLVLTWHAKREDSALKLTRDFLRQHLDALLVADERNVHAKVPLWIRPNMNIFFFDTCLEIG